jgi:hypothetical protein
MKFQVNSFDTVGSYAPDKHLEAARPHTRPLAKGYPIIRLQRAYKNIQRSDENLKQVYIKKRQSEGRQYPTPHNVEMLKRLLMLKRKITINSCDIYVCMGEGIRQTGYQSFMKLLPLWSGQEVHGSNF